MNHLDGVDLVYFAQAVDVVPKLIRIGTARSLPQRWRTLCAENASRLALLGVQVDDDATRLERRLHRRFDSWRHHDEWFEPADELLRYIAASTVAAERAKLPATSFGSVDDILDAALPCLLTIEEIAERMNVAPMTIRRHVKRRNLPHVRVGGQIRFDLGELIRDAHLHFGLR
ncbi:MAG: excisionase family DNA-binding protein [Gemmatimonadota bacterium]|nr:MAG: excisionase family DNA-binding protein [Gemmatimonadota bacterium]